MYINTKRTYGKYTNKIGETLIKIGSKLITYGNKKKKEMHAKKGKSMVDTLDNIKYTCKKQDNTKSKMQTESTNKVVSNKKLTFNKKDLLWVGKNIPIKVITDETTKKTSTFKSKIYLVLKSITKSKMFESLLYILFFPFYIITFLLMHLVIFFFFSFLYKLLQKPTNLLKTKKRLQSKYPVIYSIIRVLLLIIEIITIIPLIFMLMLFRTVVIIVGCLLNIFTLPNIILDVIPITIPYLKYVIKLTLVILPMCII